MQIPVRAYVCPYCKKTLRTSPATWGCLALIVFAFIAIGIGTERARQPRPTPTPAPMTPEQAAREAKIAKEAEENLRLDEKLEKEREAKFLASKAGKIWQKHRDWSRDDCETIAKGQIHIGMTAEQVRAAWGKPYRINETLFGRSKHEQWVMRDSPGSDYLYFEDGVLTSIQRSR